jgi:hypothetical protein
MGFLNNDVGDDDTIYQYNYMHFLKKNAQKTQAFFENMGLGLNYLGF